VIGFSFRVQGSKIQRFKDSKILIFEILYSIFWTGLFHPLGETWSSSRLTHITIVKDPLGRFNREP